MFCKGRTRLENVMRDTTGERDVLQRQDTTGERAVLQSQDTTGERDVLQRQDTTGERDVLQSQDTTGERDVLQRQDTTGERAQDSGCGAAWTLKGQCCSASTDTARTVRDGEPRTSSSTFTAVPEP